MIVVVLHHRVYMMDGSGWQEVVNYNYDIVVVRVVYPAHMNIFQHDYGSSIYEPHHRFINAAAKWIGSGPHPPFPALGRGAVAERRAWIV